MREIKKKVSHNCDHVEAGKRDSPGALEKSVNSCRTNSVMKEPFPARKLIVQNMGDRRNFL